MTERTTVRLPPELLARAKLKAAAEGRTLTALIEEGLRWVVSEKSEPKPRVVLRVSKAKGGLAPGISSLREAEELEDLEYVRRLRSQIDATAPRSLAQRFGGVTYSTLADTPAEGLWRRSWGRTAASWRQVSTNARSSTKSPGAAIEPSS
jgi:hypothetical protein